VHTVHFYMARKSPSALIFVFFFCAFCSIYRYFIFFFFWSCLDPYSECHLLYLSINRVRGPIYIIFPSAALLLDKEQNSVMFFCTSTISLMVPTCSRTLSNQSNCEDKLSLTSVYLFLFLKKIFSET
jgi:hypothetical protein